MNLKIEQRHTQVLSLAQQQTLKVLALPLPEIYGYLEQQIQDFPLLEIYGERPESLTRLMEAESMPASPVDGTESWGGGSRLDPDKQIDPLLFLTQQKTFTDDLLQQLVPLKLPTHLHDCCRYIVYSLTSQGYLLDRVEELAERTGASLEDVQQSVYIVQDLLPVGVGAQDLSECLLLQLAKSENFNPHTIRIVKDHLADLAAGRYGKISAALGISREETEKWCAFIKNLNPIPSKGYASTEYIQHLIPEASVDKKLRIAMNRAGLPRVSMGREYQNMLRSQKDPAIQEFLQENQRQAEYLTKQLTYREKTLYRVISCILEMQGDYFKNGADFLKPMSMREIADSLSLHVSTVSRAVNRKYVSTAYGIVELRVLFTNAIDNSNLSAGGVKNRIRDLIRAEDKKAPLSDGMLCKILQTQNIPISRRTVSKYRAELGIASSSQRRRLTE